MTEVRRSIMCKQGTPQRPANSATGKPLGRRRAAQEISHAWRQHDEEAMAWAELQQRIRSNGFYGKCIHEFRWRSDPEGFWK